MNTAAAPIKLVSLQTCLCAVMLAATVPLALLLGYQVFNSLQVQQQRMQEDLQRTSSVLAASVDRELAAREPLKPVAATHWQGLLQRSAPPGGFVSLMDASGRRLAHAGAGEPYAPTAEFYSAWSAVPQAGWQVVASVPAAVHDGAQRRILLAALATITACLLLGLTLATLVARRVSDPLRALARGKELPKLSQTSPVQVQEIAQLQEALASAKTERQAAEQARAELVEMEQRARIDAENANRSKDEFLAMLGHELRNPLGAIASAAEVLSQLEAKPGLPMQGDAELADTARAVITRQTRHLSHLVDDLLDVGRVISGKVVLCHQTLDMVALVRRAVENHRFTGALTRHSLALSLESAWVDGDATRIEQVLNNLLGNAIKYTPAGRQLAVHLRVAGDDVLLEVSDQGDGIAPTLLPHVFDLFVQGDRALDRRAGGLGLGLPLTRRLVEMHGGTVSVNSSAEGSTFTVRLPGVSAPSRALPPLPPPRVKPCKVLLVEDNPDALSTLQTMLELDGHRVSTAADGLMGLTRLVAERPDIAIVDIGLPGMSGFELARQGRQAGYAGQLLALTGYSSDGDVNRALQHGFDAHMAKPVDPHRLRELMALSINASAAS